MITVHLWHYTPYEPVMRAIRISHASEDRSDTVGNILGTQDYALLHMIVNQRHDSVLEHFVYMMEINGISRALLQELSRHRHISMTVQSTRFTLKKLLRTWLKNEENDIFELFQEPYDMPFDDPVLQKAIIEAYRTFIRVLQESPLKKKNDWLKYLIPEGFRTKLMLTVNARELAHIINLRTSPQALPEFRVLAMMMYDTVHEVHPQLWDMLAEREGWKWVRGS